MDVRQGRLENAVGWGVALALMGLLTYPVGRWLVGQWLTNEYYSHGVLVLLVSAYLVWRVLRSGRAASVPADAALVFLGSGAGVYVVGEALIARYLSALGLILLAGGLVGFLGSRETLRRLAFPLAYLVFAVPFPFVDSLAVRMGTLTAGWATVLVRGLGVTAVNEGGQVRLPSCSLVVGAPCSGVRSLVALLALAAVWAYVVRGPRLARIALLALAVPLASLANLLRVTSLLWVADRWGLETAQRYYHDFSGPVFFTLALVGLLAVSWGLRCRDLRSDI
jgi:exosortase